MGEDSRATRRVQTTGINCWSGVPEKRMLFFKVRSNAGRGQDRLTFGRVDRRGCCGGIIIATNIAMVKVASVVWIFTDVAGLSRS